MSTAASTMRSRGLLAVAVVVGVFTSWLILRPPPPRVAVLALADELPRARDARPSAGAFRVVDAAIGGIARRSILVTQTSRLVFSVSVPEGAALRVSLALAEEAWTVEGDGVLFRVLVGSPERGQIEVLHHVADPFSAPADRGWHDAEVDLSAYAGETIALFFNTNASLPGRDDARGDLALWGDPRIVAPEKSTSGVD
jgi:hypothetical protein